MTRDEFIALLPDEEARKWAAEEPGGPARLWQRCKRGDWMLHVVGQMDIPRQQLVLAACACARLALKYVAEGDERPRIAIETAEGWCRGERSLEEVRNASASAASAASAAYAAGNRQLPRLRCARIARKFIPWRFAHVTSMLRAVAVA